jgi:hypothetical protein
MRGYRRENRLARCILRRHSGEQQVRRRKSAAPSSPPLGRTRRMSGLPHPGLAHTGPSWSAGRRSLVMMNARERHSSLVPDGRDPMRVARQAQPHAQDRPGTRRSGPSPLSPGAAGNEAGHIRFRRIHLQARARFVSHISSSPGRATTDSASTRGVPPIRRVERVPSAGRTALTQRACVVTLGDTCASEPTCAPSPDGGRMVVS